jgi:DNA polymerase-3 subunit beta
MKLKVNKDAALANLQKIQSVISTRTTLPILSNIHFKAEQDRLWLTATDLEVSVRTSFESEIAKAGGTTLPAKRIISIFRELAANDIEIEVDDKDQAAIRAGASFFRIIGLSEDEFPPLPKFEGGKTYTIEQRIFRDMLRNTSYAASKDENRYLLNGVLLSFKAGKLTVVATDGRRMALMEQEIEFPKDAEADLVIPAKTVDELGRTLGEKGEVRITATGNQVAFEFGDILLVSKLVDGTYPNFRQVIPAQCEERATFVRDELLTALRRVAVIASEKSNSVTLGFSKNRLEITVKAPDVGEARESIDMKYTGKPINIAFNAEFLMDPLRCLTADEVHLELTDELNPGVMKCIDPFIYVLMPMRTSAA